MVKLLKKLWEAIFCQHDWQFSQFIERDYNLRTGRVGQSVANVCAKCGRHQTLEIE